MANKRDKETSAGVDVTSWINMCESLDEYYTDKYKVEKAKANVPPTWSYYNPARFTTSGSRGGDDRLRSLRAALKFYDANGTKRSKHQVQFHDAFIASCIRHIYKGEFASNYMRILQDNDWEECKQEVLVCCPQVVTTATARPRPPPAPATAQTCSALPTRRPAAIASPPLIVNPPPPLPAPPPRPLLPRVPPRRAARTQRAPIEPDQGLTPCFDAQATIWEDLRRWNVRRCLRDDAAQLLHLHLLARETPI